MNLIVIGTMTDKYNYGNIHDAYIAFQDDPTSGKQRPILILKKREEFQYLIYQITTSEPETPFQKRTRYELEDWKIANLDKKSFIKIYPEDARVITDSELSQHRGCLTEKDKLGLKNHILALQKHLQENLTN